MVVVNAVENQYIGRGPGNHPGHRFGLFVTLQDIPQQKPRPLAGKLCIESCDPQGLGPRKPRYQRRPKQRQQDQTICNSSPSAFASA